MIKENANYFGHDADMRNDIKVKALRRNYGNNGYAVWCYLLESLTDANGYELEWNTENAELLAADFDVTPDQLIEIVTYCLRLHLLQVENGKLFSIRHKERFENLENLRQTLSEAGKRGAEKRWGGNKGNIATPCPPYSPPMGSDGKLNKIRGNKIKEDIDIRPNGLTSKSEAFDPGAGAEKTKILKEYKEFYNSEVIKNNSTMHKVQKLETSMQRAAWLLARIREYGEDSVREVITKAAQSNFLNGDNKRGFIADFGWIMRPNNFPKVLEGNYDNNTKNNNHGNNQQPDRRHGYDATATSAEEYKGKF